MPARPPATAVVVDEWPLVRLGIGQALRSLSVRVAVELSSGADAVRRLGETGAGWLILGTFRDIATDDVIRKAASLEEPPRVVVLLDHVSRESLGSLLSLGVDALLVRSVGPEELSDTVARVSKGERVVAPSLLPLLVGVLGTTAPDEESQDGPDGALTRKELEVLTRLAEGRSNKDIADALYVTPATVKTHLAHIYTKLGVAGRQEAVARAVELGLLR